MADITGLFVAGQNLLNSQGSGGSGGSGGGASFSGDLIRFYSVDPVAPPASGLGGVTISTVNLLNPAIGGTGFGGEIWRGLAQYFDDQLQGMVDLEIESWNDTWIKFKSWPQQLQFDLIVTNINGISSTRSIDLANAGTNFVARLMTTAGKSYFMTDAEFSTLFSSNASWSATARGVSVPNTEILGLEFLPSFSRTVIANDFLRGCTSFNQPLTLPSSLTSIGDSFLYGCTSFNQPLTLPNALTSIGNYFLSSCSSFNQPLTLPNTLTSIGDSFLYGCTSFNQPLTLPNALTSIGNYFLSSCSSFNQPLTLPNTLTSIGDSFLYGCTSFNQPLTLPNTLTSIGNNFLRSCTSFNQPLTLPNALTSIGNYFLQICTSFNQPLTLPNTLTSIGNYFLSRCNSLVSGLSIGSLAATVFPSDNNSIATNLDTAQMYVAGVPIYGTNRAALMTRLPNMTTTPFRKLLNGGS